MLALYRFLELLMFPPGSTLLLGIFGLYVVKRRLALGRFLIASAIVLTWAFSTPLVSFALLDVLQDRYPRLDTVPPMADSIVVLGAGREFYDNEFGREQDLSGHALQRVRYAAYLAKQTGLPVITSGGQVWEEPGTEAELAQAILLAEFGVTNVVTEKESRTTLQNAERSINLMQQLGLKNPLLVTEYWHMPRAKYSFSQYGVEAFAAPTGRITPNFTDKGVWAVLPKADALARSNLALHEWLGRVWYRLRF